MWEPFFAGAADDPRNGTEEIITSSVSEAWPVSDAAAGGYTYLLEILTGIVAPAGAEMDPGSETGGYARVLLL